MSSKKNKVSIKIDGTPSSTKDGINEKLDELDLIIQQTVDQVEDTAQLSQNIAKRVAETENIAANSLNTLHKQGEQINNISTNMNGLQTSIDTASRDAKYLKNLTGYFFIPVSAPKHIDSSVISKLEFASNAPKDELGRPMAAPRITSLSVGAVKTIDHAVKPVRSPNSAAAIQLDDTATLEQKQRFAQAEETIDQNLDLVSRGVGNLRQAALSMGNELNRQSQVVDKINEKADTNIDKLGKLNANVNSMLSSNKKKSK